MNCYSDGAAVVSWNATRGTANVSVVDGSLKTLCTSQYTSCNVTGLSCGETYNLSLTASNEQCNLTAPTRANFTTREFLQFNHKWQVFFVFINLTFYLRFRPLPSSADRCRSAVWLPYGYPVLGKEVQC